MEWGILAMEWGILSMPWDGHHRNEGITHMGFSAFIAVQTTLGLIYAWACRAEAST